MDEKLEQAGVIPPAKESTKYNFHIPEISALIIVFGLLRQLFYYTNFNVPIKYFLGLSELGLLVSDNLFSAGIVVIAILIAPSLEFSLPDNTPLKLDLNKTLHRYILLGLFCIAGTVLAYFAFTTKHFYNRVLFLTLFGYLFILYYGMKESSALRGYLQQRKILGIFIIVLTLLTALISAVATEIESVEKGRYKGTNIETKDGRNYPSTDTSYFIGKTDKYVFIFTTRDSSTLIIPTESIRQMTLKQRLRPN